MFNEKALLVDGKKEGIDERVDEILKNVDGPLAATYKKVKDLNKNPLKKRYIEASLFCEKDLRRITKILEMPLEDLMVYKEFFFEVEGLDRLTKIQHIETVSAKNKEEGLLKLWSLSHGIEFIEWRLGYRIEISPVQGLVDLFSTCIYKSKEAMFNSSSTDASRESTKWTKLSTDIARLLKMWVMDSNEAKKDLEIAIREVLPEFDGLDSVLENPEDLISLEDSIATTINTTKQDD